MTENEVHFIDTLLRGDDVLFSFQNNCKEDL